ncbi:MAG: zinc ribbon domain-containing protein [Candidatus Thermoplasmatota archaeon]
MAFSTGILSPFQIDLLFGGAICFIIIGFWIIFLFIAIWVYRDAESRGMGGVLWLLIVLLTGIIGLIIYIVVRSDRPVMPAGYPYPGQYPGYYPPQAPPPTAPPPSAAPAPAACRNCGAALQPGVAFCPHCGARV